jgi:hypothetical protein
VEAVSQFRYPRPYQFPEFLDDLSISRALVSELDKGTFLGFIRKSSVREEEDGAEPALADLLQYTLITDGPSNRV